MSKIKILTIVDMQNDYMEGGPMAVKGATKLVPVINDLIKNGEYDAIIAIMASGILIRSIAPLINSKITDPASR